MSATMQLDRPMTAVAGPAVVAGTVAAAVRPGRRRKTGDRAQPGTESEATGDLRIAPFTADITPPVGSPLDCGFDPPVATVEHALLAKGVVLEDRGGTYVLCAIDWTGLCNAAYDLVRERIAKAANTTPSHVALQAVHQHTAPAIDLDAQRVLDNVPGAPIHADVMVLERTARRIAKAVGEATWRRVNHVGAQWSAVDRVASNRRVLKPDGSILARMSSTTDPAQHSAPEGLVDGYVRTVSFLEDDSPVARLHYYATHPQSYYGDGRVTYDVPGIARARIEQETGVHQVYFNGCGGDLAMGKYNDGTPEARQRLSQRLYEGMKHSCEAPEASAVEPIRWRTRSIHLMTRREPEFTRKVNQETLADRAASVTERIQAAMVIAFEDRARNERPFELSCLSIGPVKLLHLPGEAFVAYQLYAQQARPDRFVVTAAYGDCAMWYIPTDEAFTQTGGYETSWAFASPCEREMKKAIEEVMKDG